MASRWLAAALTAVLVASCTGAPEPASAPPSDSSGATAGAATSSQPPTVTAPPPSSAPAVAPSDHDPVAGVWWVRKVLSPANRSGLIPGAAFQDESYSVTATCRSEPCPTLRVRITPLAHATPVTEVDLKLDGDRYVSAAQAENEGPCLNADHDRVQGGATVTSTVRLWLTNVKAAGSAIERIQLAGSMTLDLAPTSVGKAAGCKPQAAAYDLSGSRIRMAESNGQPEPEPIPNEPPNTAGGMASLPALKAEAVTGATIDYFPIEGDTLNELGQSLANGGLGACGAINYEWHEGDDRPAACVLTSFPGIDNAIHENKTAGACTIDKATVQAQLNLEFPRWTLPKRVPRPLLDWWRKVVVFIRDHEAGHVAITRERTKALNAKLVGSPCTLAIKIIQDWATKLSAAQEHYDQVEYDKPWPVPPKGY